jgi:hypothetical protein
MRSINTAKAQHQSIRQSCQFWKCTSLTSNMSKVLTKSSSFAMLQLPRVHGQSVRRVRPRRKNDQAFAPFPSSDALLQVVHLDKNLMTTCAAKHHEKQTFIENHPHEPARRWKISLPKSPRKSRRLVQILFPADHKISQTYYHHLRPS